MIVTKREFAVALGVSLSTVSTWIARQKLTAPALLTDGRIDDVLGREQLAISVDLARSRGRAPSGLFGHLDKPDPAPVDDGRRSEAAPIMSGYADRLARARGDLIEIDLAERDLREEISAGRLMPIAAARREFLAKAAQIVAEVDTRLADLADLIASSESDAIALALAKGQVARWGDRWR